MRNKLIGIALFGVGIAALLGWHGWTSSTDAVDPVAMLPDEVTDRQVFGRRSAEAADAPEVEALLATPAPPLTPKDDYEAHVQGLRLSRADWVGGAVVSCDLGEDAIGHDQVLFDAGAPFSAEGPVDGVSRLATRIHDGRISFVVTEPAGETRATLIDTVRRDGVRTMAPDTVAVRIWWTGAEPGAEVGCTATAAERTVPVTIEVVDAPGRLAGTTDGEWGHASYPVIQGCGLVFPLTTNPVEVSLPEGACTLRVDNRNGTFGAIVNRGTEIPVTLGNGDNRVTLTLPDAPPLWQPPDLLELEAASGAAAWLATEVGDAKIEEALNAMSRGDLEPAEELWAKVQKEREQR